jgi:hypothetical protein
MAKVLSHKLRLEAILVRLNKNMNMEDRPELIRPLGSSS